MYTRIALWDACTKRVIQANLSLDRRPDATWYEARLLEGTHGKRNVRIDETVPWELHEEVDKVMRDYELKVALAEAERRAALMYLHQLGKVKDIFVDEDGKSVRVP